MHQNNVPPPDIASFLNYVEKHNVLTIQSEVESKIRSIMQVNGFTAYRIKDLSLEKTDYLTHPLIQNNSLIENLTKKYGHLSIHNIAYLKCIRDSARKQLYQSREYKDGNPEVLQVLECLAEEESDMDIFLEFFKEVLYRYTEEERKKANLKRNFIHHTHPLINTKRHDDTIIPGSNNFNNSVNV